MNIGKIRSDFPALGNFVWFQNGGVSITPAPVAEAHIGLMRELLERGPMHIAYPDEEYPRRERSRERLAAFFGVSPGDLALMRGVSEAFQTVIRGLDWNAGDRILISEEEEVALLVPCLHLRDLYGVVVDKAPLVDDADEQVEAVVGRITDRTRLIGFSHVISDSGYRLPAERICAAARARGVVSFLDMAHSAGLYPMNLNRLGCDFAGILSYKWMYSPYAAGALFARADRRDRIRVTYAGGRAQDWVDFRRDRFELKESTERFEFGPWSWPLVHAWAAAVEYLTCIGLDAIWARTVVLTTRLKRGLNEIPGVRLITPLSPEQSAAVVGFNLDGWQPLHVRDALRKRWRIVVKAFNTTRQGLRASVPFFLLEEEIDLLLHALATLASEDPGRPSAGSLA
ncbi:MAG: aminotransferase class V-fold PLP-dependent enzyme [Gemmatimonadota bacterium]|nr:aminotransferase class V-fold PLP-dependent enzyme [Gemmatimonadota bacterium]